MTWYQLLEMEIIKIMKNMSCRFLDLKEVLSIMKIIDVAMYLVHSTIPLLKLTMDMFFYFENGNTSLYALTT